MRPAIAATGTQVAFVHAAAPEDADPWFARHGLSDVARLSDPDQVHYRAFGLGRGTLGQLLGPTVWWRGAQAALAGHGVGAPTNDPWLMPGLFIVHEGRVIRALRHETAADRPDYLAFVTGG